MKRIKIQPLSIIAILCFLFTVNSAFSQALPLSINFENSDYTLINYDDGGVGTIVDNPLREGSTNLSAKVGKIVRGTGNLLEDNDAWAGSKLVLANKLNFEVLECISLKVYTTAPIGTKVSLKLENSSSQYEPLDMFTRSSSAWQTMIWDFSGTPADYDQIVFMFDRDNIGDGSASSTFYFDDIRHVLKKNRFQIDLPVNFDEGGFDYTTTDFGGNESSLVIDPEDENNKVIKVIKPRGAASWAGTTIGTDDGFVNNIPLTTSNSIMTVRIWAERAGIPVMLKVENSNNATQNCETVTNTTSPGWQVMTFDFTNERTGTQALDVGLANGSTFNKASLFFNYGRDGNQGTYYFDDVTFVTN